jgi:hypothetical protein
MSPSKTIVNLGGEGEVPGVINQLPPFVLAPTWRASRDGKTLEQLVADGHAILICSNLQLPYPDGSVDEVITNGVPINQVTPFGPGVQTSEIRRILKSGGSWINNGAVQYVKP